MAKAKRLIQSGQVTMLRNGYNNIIGHVIGDHGDYDTEISRDDPSSRAITGWQCSCPWDQYAWGRTRKWKKFEGRPCAHVLALFWKALSTPFDHDLDEDQANNMGTGQKVGPEKKPGPDTQEFGLPRSVSPEGEAIQGDQMKLDMPDATGGPPGPAQAPMAPPPSQGAQPPGILPAFKEPPPPYGGPGTTPGGGESPPGAMSIPGAKPPSPFNPIQLPGTHSKVAGQPCPQCRGTGTNPATTLPCGGCGGTGSYGDPVPEAQPPQPIDDPRLQRVLQQYHDIGRQVNALRGPDWDFGNDPGWDCHTGANMMTHLLTQNGFSAQTELGRYWHPDASRLGAERGEDPESIPAHLYDELHYWTSLSHPQHGHLLVDPNGEARGEPRVQHATETNQYPEYANGDLNHYQGQRGVYEPFWDEETEQGNKWDPRYKESYPSEDLEPESAAKWDTTLADGMRLAQGRTAGSWDPLICESCGHPMTEPERSGSGFMNHCTYCGRSRSVPSNYPLLMQQEQSMPAYPQALQEVGPERPWVFAKTAATFEPDTPVILKKDILGMAQGPKPGQYGDGEYRNVAAGQAGLARHQDPTTGWVDCIFDLNDSGPNEPFRVQCFCEPSDIEPAQGMTPSDPFINRRTKVAINIREDEDGYSRWWDGESEPLTVFRGLHFGYGSLEDIKRLKADPYAYWQSVLPRIENGAHSTDRLGTYWSADPDMAKSYARDNHPYESWYGYSDGYDEPTDERPHAHGIVLHGVVAPQHLDEPEDYGAGEEDQEAYVHGPVTLTHVTGVWPGGEQTQPVPPELQQRTSADTSLPPTPFEADMYRGGGTRALEAQDRPIYATDSPKGARAYGDPTPVRVRFENPLHVSHQKDEQGRAVGAWYDQIESQIGMKPWTRAAELGHDGIVYDWGDVDENNPYYAGRQWAISLQPNRITRASAKFADADTAVSVHARMGPVPVLGASTHGDDAQIAFMRHKYAAVIDQAGHQLWFKPSIRTQRDQEYGRGMVHDPTGTVHTWPESEATHASMIAMNGYRDQDCMRFYMEPTGVVGDMYGPSSALMTIMRADPALARANGMNPADLGA